MLLVGTIGVGGLGWLVLRILDNDLRRTPEHAENIAAFARWMIDHRGVVPLLTLPAAIAAIWLISVRGKAVRPAHSRASPWIILALATLWLLLVFAVVLVVFVQFMAPLYEYHEIG